jgi:SNF2 family DNA or RNA helicase
MLPRQPLRFLLADDPGAGKTIMAGLLMKELIARGDLHRCLVVCPGSLAEQWQDELYRRFHLPFEILTNDKLEAARTGNWFLAMKRRDIFGLAGLAFIGEFALPMGACDVRTTNGTVFSA